MVAMLIRIALMSLICFVLAGCLSSEQNNKTSKPNPEIPKQSIEPKPKPKPKLEDQKIAVRNTNPLNYSGNFMTLIPTGQTNTQDNPLYRLSLYADGKLVHSFVSVSGRTSTQDRNRHQSGTEAPLPDGKYTVATVYLPSGKGASVPL